VTRTICLSLILIFTFHIYIPLYAEETKDMEEGIAYGDKEGGKWGLLPRIKYNPETNFGSGLKFKASNIFSTNLLTDLSFIYTLNEYQIYEFLIMDPKILDGTYHLMLYFEYDVIPTQRFFGLGNSTVNKQDIKGEMGDESNYYLEDFQTKVTFGKKIVENFYMAFLLKLRSTDISEGDNENLPSTTIKYPDVPGIEGGTSNSMGLALIYNTRDDQFRPSKGCRIKLSAEETNKALFNYFDFTRYIFDIRRFINIFGKYNIIALRLQAEEVEGKAKEIPFYEMGRIGGRDSLRGYWDDRFQGRGKVLINAEYRFKLYEIIDGFGFLDVVFDGLIFFDSGRVFLDQKDWYTDIAKDYKYSYGAGIRATIPPGIMARLDIGFSEEQIFSVYANFGTVF